jgi:hypothetical protein
MSKIALTERVAQATIALAGPAVFFLSMRTAVTHITILALLTHAVVGCCWHHDHDGTCESHSHGEFVVDVEGLTHGHDHSGATHACAGEDERHSEGTTCCADEHAAACSDAQCVFVKSQPRNWVAAPVAAIFDAALLTNRAPAASRSSAPTRTHGRLPRDSAISLCAQLQVWLI